VLAVLLEKEHAMTHGMSGFETLMLTQWHERLKIEKHGNET
jgi:hypothetical protein